MPISDVLTWLGLAAGGLLALGVIWTKGLRPLYRFLRRVEDVHQLIIDDLPTFMDEMKAWQANADQVLKQLQPNSGSSMFDRVARTEAMVREHANDPSLHGPARIETRRHDGGS